MAAWEKGCALPGARAPKVVLSTLESRRPSVLPSRVSRPWAHKVVETVLPLEGWNQAFGPLVLAEERRERGDLLQRCPDVLSDYVRKSLAAAQTLTDDEIAAGHAAHRNYRAHMAALFETWDAIATPATAVTAFPLTSGRSGSPAARSTGFGAHSPSPYPSMSPAIPPYRCPAGSPTACPWVCSSSCR